MLTKENTGALMRSGGKAPASDLIWVEFRMGRNLGDGVVAEKGSVHQVERRVAKRWIQAGTAAETDAPKKRAKKVADDTPSDD